MHAPIQLQTGFHRTMQEFLLPSLFLSPPIESISPFKAPRAERYWLARYVGTSTCREFEYKRHAAQTLIGNFRVVTGEMISPTVGETLTEEDFVNHIRQTVKADPDASWIFVADDLNRHWHLVPVAHKHS